MGEELIDFALLLLGAALLIWFGANATRNSQRTQNHSESGCYSGDSVEIDTYMDNDEKEAFEMETYQMMYIIHENNQNKSN